MRQLIGDMKAVVARQAEIAAGLEQSGARPLADRVRGVLRQMIGLLSRMENAAAAEERRLAELADPLDEEILDEVARDCPL